MEYPCSKFFSLIADEFSFVKCEMICCMINNCKLTMQRILLVYRAKHVDILYFITYIAYM